MAVNVKDALKKEKHIKADEAWIDDDWKKNNPEACENKIIGYKPNK